jgi:hypothetical protein
VLDRIWQPGNWNLAGHGKMKGGMQIGEKTEGTEGTDEGGASDERDRERCGRPGAFHARAHLGRCEHMRAITSIFVPLHPR